MGIFGSVIPPEEKLKTFKRSLRTAVRRLEGERRRLQNEEIKMKNAIRLHHAKGEIESVMILCRDIVRNRSAMSKFLKLASQLESVGLQIELMRARTGMTHALRGAARAIHQLNQMVNVPRMQGIIQQFTMENEAMELRAEMGDDLMDMIMDGDGALEEDTAVQYARVLSELGVPLPPQVAASLPRNAAPSR
jgi:division protein CdvB (Snf7/Vps24/ESCRT-III family)